MPNELDYFGELADSGAKMKQVEFTHWATPNDGATNSSGLSHCLAVSDRKTELCKARPFMIYGRVLMNITSANLVRSNTDIFRKWLPYNLGIQCKCLEY